MTIKIIDFPKIQSPFVRKLNEKNEYVITPEITEGADWVFSGGEDEVKATEKLDGTCCAILIENGVVTAMFNRTNRISFIGGTLSKALTEGVNNAFAKERFVMQDGLWWGELIGKKINGNPYNLTEYEWIPFEWAKEHLAYKSFHKYPKTFANLNKWFLDDIKDGGLFSLFMKRQGIDMKPEGIVFHNVKTGQMLKYRQDMIEGYKGARHKENEEQEKTK
jgi:hypothetical protein